MHQHVPEHDVHRVVAERLMLGRPLPILGGKLLQSLDDQRPRAPLSASSSSLLSIADPASSSHPEAQKQTLPQLWEALPPAVPVVLITLDCWVHG